MILNEGNHPTFINSVRKEVIDITLCSPKFFREVSNWHVSLDDCMCDHQTIHLKLFANRISASLGFLRHPRRTNREASITATVILECETEFLVDSIVLSYEESSLRGRPQITSLSGGGSAVCYEAL